LVLGRNPRRRRDRRQRLHALALAAGKKTRAVIAKGACPVAMAYNVTQPLDKNRKTRFTLLCTLVIHARYPVPMRESSSAGNFVGAGM
jgi:hypothetical protein